MRLFSSLLLFSLTASRALADSPLPGAAWPSFRGDWANTGNAARMFTPDAMARPWSYASGKGIFSTAVVDEYGQIYVGSADSWFYALSSDGLLQWRYKTGQIIDSAAVLSTDGQGRWITIPSGDGRLHHLELPGFGTQGNPVASWTFDAMQHPHPAGKGYNWFEGNVTVGPDGKYYAGNTNWNFYAVSDQGALAWTFAANNMNWSAAAFDAAGFLYTASLDGQFRKLDPRDGKVIWSRRSLGFNAGSIAMSDGLAIGTSFDHRVYALDPDNGKVLWTFATRDHIYGSAALSGLGDGLRIYVTSTDGYLYALSHEGKLLWAFDSGDVIRSSPVVNQAPDGQDVIYFGGGDGILRAVNQDGSFRWAFDTNSQDPYLSERNDLNASPALTPTSIVIGGEHGHIWSVPYDYPRLHPEDPRSITNPPVSRDGIHARIVTPGSRLLPVGETTEISPATVLVIRLENRIKGARQAGGVNAWWNKTRIRIDPALPFHWEPSAQADTITIRPDRFWEPGQRYRVSIDGEWMQDGLKFGAIEIGATRTTPFQSSVEFSVARASFDTLPWSLATDKVDALEIYRLSVNQPSLMPSLNQIGFDSYHFLASLIEKTPPDSNGEGQLLVWIRSAGASESGDLVPLEQAEFRFPMRGHYKGDAFILSGENIPLNLGGIQMKLKRLEFRGQFMQGRIITPMTSFYAEPAASVDLSYGPGLVALGILNKNWKVPMAGTFLARTYHGSATVQTTTYKVKQYCLTPPTLWKEGVVGAILEGDPKAATHGFEFMAYHGFTLEPVLLPEPPFLESIGSGIWFLKQSIPRQAWSTHGRIYLMDGIVPHHPALDERPRCHGLELSAEGVG